MSSAPSSVLFEFTRPLADLIALALGLPKGVVLRRTGALESEVPKLREKLRQTNPGFVQGLEDLFPGGFTESPLFKAVPQGPPSDSLVIAAVTALKAANPPPFTIGTQADLLTCAQLKSTFAAGEPDYCFTSSTAAALPDDDPFSFLNEGPSIVDTDDPGTVSDTPNGTSASATVIPFRRRHRAA